MSDITTVNARVSGIRQTPRKLGMVASLVRGRSVVEALTILQHTPKRAAKPLAKLITAAKANAINNFRLKEDGLMISSLQVTAGPRLKRIRPAAMGRAAPYQKRSTHIVIQVTGEVKPKKPADAAKSTEKEKA